jgi:hypothetical protein
MRLTGKITEEELADVRKLVQSKWYWPRLLLANWYGFALLGIILFATVDALAHGTKVNWKGFGIIWGIIGAIFGWAYYRSKRSMAKEFAALSASLPDWMFLENGGIRFDGPNGATAFQPWANYKGWREKGRVILIDRAQNKGFTVLLVSALSETERQSLRAMLDSSVPTLRK